jgi:outer membrane lipoprotein SlyB
MAITDIRAPKLSGLLQSFAQLQQASALQAQRKAKKLQEERDRKSNSLRTIGTIAGAVIGGIYGAGPAGAAAGAQIGNTAGGMIASAQGGNRVSSAEVASSAGGVARFQESERRQATFEAQEQDRQQRLAEQRRVLAEQEQQRQLDETRVQNLADEAKQSILKGRDASELTGVEKTKYAQVVQFQERTQAPAQQRVQGILQVAPDDVRFKSKSIVIGNRRHNILTDRLTGDTRVSEEVPRGRAGIGRAGQAKVVPLSKRLERSEDILKKRKRVFTPEEKLANAKQAIRDDMITATPEQAELLEEQLLELDKQETLTPIKRRLNQIRELSKKDPEEAKRQLSSERDDLVSRASEAPGVDERQMEEFIANVSVDIEKSRRGKLAGLQEFKEAEVTEATEKERKERLAKERLAKGLAFAGEQPFFGI